MYISFQMCYYEERIIKIERLFFMIQLIESINVAINNFVWGVPAMVCIIGVGLYLSIRTRFLQIQ